MTFKTIDESTVEITGYPFPAVMGQEILRDGKVVAIVLSSRMFNSEKELLSFIADQWTG
jgi:hypothetical protein